jgi:CYTH domain-containing protein
MIEIERKFLVVNDKYKMGTPQRISQGYICSENDRVVRVRIKGDKAYLTIKNATIGFARNEYEYEIPVADAEAMLKNTCQQPIIDKTRYVLEYKGFIWEVDEFHGDNEGLVVAEIELDSRETTFDHPDFIGEEVTGDARYYNACLFKNPYKMWR